MNLRKLNKVKTKYCTEIRNEYMEYLMKYEHLYAISFNYAYMTDTTTFFQNLVVCRATYIKRTVE